MKVRIGVADTSKVIELEVDDVDSFKSELERVISEGGLAWFTDTTGGDVAIPGKSVAFVEIEASESGPAVGFATV